MVKVFVISVMFIILFALGSGLFFLIRDAGSTRRTVKALSWRIGLSLTLFLFLLLCFAMGWMQPHGL